MADLPSWAEGLPEAMHEMPHLAKSESAEQFVQAVQNDAQWRGQSIRIPSEDADDGAWDEFRGKLESKVPVDKIGEAYTKHGVPESAENYRLPEGVELADADKYKAVAHALDMSQSAFESFVNMEVSGNADALMAAQEALDSGYAGLKTEWGAAYEQNYAAVERVLAGAPAGVLESYKAGTLPADQVKWLHSLAELGGESVEAQGQEAKSVMTPEQAELELTEFRPKFFRMHKNDPGYKAASAKYERLVALSIGEVA